MKRHLFLGAMTAALAFFMACADNGGESLDAGAGTGVTTGGNYTIDIVRADEYDAAAASANVSILNTNKAWVPGTTANSGDEVKLTITTMGGGGG
jgi:hypothetical protein